MFMKKIGMILLAFMLILCNGASASALTVQASFNDPLIEEAGQAFAGDAVKILESGSLKLACTVKALAETPPHSASAMASSAVPVRKRERFIVIPPILVFLSLRSHLLRSLSILYHARLAKR